MMTSGQKHHGFVFFAHLPQLELHHHQAVIDFLPT